MIKGPEAVSLSTGSTASSECTRPTETAMAPKTVARPRLLQRCGPAPAMRTRTKAAIGDSSAA